MSLSILTVVWGKMTDWYLQWHIPAVLQAGNLPDLKNAGYFVYTDQPERVRSVISKAVTKINAQVFPLVNGPGHVNDCIKDCATKFGGHLAMIAPDSIYGSPSLSNLEKLCDKYDLVLYGFPRCRMKVLDQIVPMLEQHKPLTNAQLVSLAMAYLHRETGPPSVCLKRLNRDTWNVQHLVPTPVIRINDKSLAFINSIPSANSLFDHVVPLLCIEAGMSFHYVQDSDEFFLLEPTNRRQAICRTPPYEGRLEWEALTQRNMDFWKKFTATWKGDPSAGSKQAWRRGYLGRLYNKLASYTD